MPYTKKTYYAGKTIIVEKSYSGKRQAGPRDIKKTPTREAVEKNNRKQAERKLTILMNANFKKNDMHIVLTYAPQCRPFSPEIAKKLLDKFIRKLRAEFKKCEMELKYIHCTEYKGKAIHHHILISSFDIAIIQKLWPYGRIRPTLIYTNDLSALAKYFIKETSETFREESSAYKQRYSPSRNLIRPIAKKEKIHAKSWKKEPKPAKGYYILFDTLENGTNEITGFDYQYYIMELIE